MGIAAVPEVSLPRVCLHSPRRRVRADRQAEPAALIPDPWPNGPPTAPDTRCFTATVWSSGFLLAARTCPRLSSTPYVSFPGFFFSSFESSEENLAAFVSSSFQLFKLGQLLSVSPMNSDFKALID